MFKPQTPLQEGIIIVLLAAIWGSSFIFMRILAPSLPAIVVSSLRILIAGLFIYVVFSVRKKSVNIKRNYAYYFYAGMLNSGIPFTLYAFAAKHIPAGYSVILNSLTPIFTAILAYFFLNEKLNKYKILGIILGFIGVYILMYPKISIQSNQFNIYAIYGILACIGATFCYALGSIFTKKYLEKDASEDLAAYTQILASFALLPFWLFNQPFQHIEKFFIDYKLALSLLALSILCSSLAYIMYFNLIKSSGAVKAVSVTFIIPVFGILWSYIFLHEKLPQTAYISVCFILLSVFLILRKN
jgi:drug/metabolite transporter (DMT)-like permease